MAERESRVRSRLLVPTCADFIRDRCRRDQCRYAHPSSSVEIEQDDGRDAVAVCFDSLRDRCTRASCRYFHPPGYMIPDLLENSRQGKPATAPSDYTRQRANPFPGSHPGIAPQRAFSRPVLEVCRDFLKDRCKRDASECRYAHTQPTAGEGNLVTVCQDFLKHRCERDNCRYFHPAEHLLRSINYMPLGPPQGQLPLPPPPQGFPFPFGQPHSQPPLLSPFTPGPPFPMVQGGGGRAGGGMLGMPPQGLPMDPIAQAAYEAASRAFMEVLEQQAGSYHKRMKLEGDSMAMGGGGGMEGYADPYAAAAAAAAAAAGMYPQQQGLDLPPMAIDEGRARKLPGNQDDGNKVPVCRDFLRDKCARPSCRFAHPSKHVEILHFTVSLCRDAQRGKCTREPCKYYHPPTGHGNGE